MRLLDRYLLRELLIPLGYCLGGLLVFWIACDLLSDLDDFQQEKLTALEIARYYLVRMPTVLELLSPVALLLGLLYALTNHARHQELIAMRAAGLSLWRLCLPYLAVGLLLSLGLRFLTEDWLPNSSDLADQIRHRHDRANPAARDWRDDLSFWNQSDNRRWHIRSFNVKTGEMLDPYVDWERPDGSHFQLLAGRAVWTNGVWTFLDNVRRQVLKPGAESLASMQPVTNEFAVPEFTETPEQIKSEIKVSQLQSVKAAKGVHLTTAEIRDYKRLHPRLAPGMKAMLDTQLYARQANPWTSLVVVLIAVPFGAGSGRRNVFVGVASGIFICFGYFVLQKLGLALGTGGHVPPLAAAWLPNALFGAAGVWLLSHVR